MWETFCCLWLTEKLCLREGWCHNHSMAEAVQRSLSACYLKAEEEEAEKLFKRILFKLIEIQRNRREAHDFEKWLKREMTSLCLPRLIILYIDCIPRSPVEAEEKVLKPMKRNMKKPEDSLEKQSLFSYTITEAEEAEVLSREALYVMKPLNVISINYILWNRRLWPDSVRESSTMWLPSSPFLYCPIENV